MSEGINQEEAIACIGVTKMAYQVFNDDKEKTGYKRYFKCLKNLDKDGEMDIQKNFVGLKINSKYFIVRFNEEKYPVAIEIYNIKYNGEKSFHKALNPDMLRLLFGENDDSNSEMEN